MLAADKIKRLNRLYAVSSGINEAIVRVPDESQLYLEACRIAVERGGFVMAWVGLVDKESELLAPVARWGQDDGYVDTVHISTAPSSIAGRGPGGRAFRTGETQVSNDIEADLQFFAYREEALAHGYRSCAAFPLKLGGVPVGVFFVYAPEPLYFDEEELALLTSLADNFSFAIEARERETQRAQMETALRSSEARLRAVVDNEPECVKVLDIDGVLTDVNPAGVAMLRGGSAAQMIGRNVIDIVHPDDRDAYRAMHARVLQGESAQLQARAIDFSGRQLWMDTHAAPLRSDDGRIVNVLCVTRDVTQQRAHIQQLEQQQSLLAMASRLGKFGAWEIDLKKLRVTWSDELCLIHNVPTGFALTPEEALSFYAPEHRPVMTDAIKACARTGAAFDEEVDVVTRRGRRLSVRCIGEAVRDDDGAIVRVQGAFQDITERLASEREIRRLNAELEQRVRQRTAQLENANRELQAFSYSVAHDLRAPLMAIGGFSQALEHTLGATATDRVKHYIHRMREGVLHTSEMIDALLSLARFSRTELRWEEVDISLMAERAATSAKERHPELELHVSIEPGMRAEGDARLLQLVLDNLVANAWKFSAPHPGGTIKVATQLSPSGETIYEVRDEGVGFDMAYASNLFGAFQRLHKQSEFPGTGIGLANVRRIVARHAGRVWAQSSPGKGAIFYFTLGNEPA